MGGDYSSMRDKLEVVLASPGVRAWTKNSLRHRLRAARDTAAKLRRAYATEPYASACELLAGLEDRAAAACQELLEEFDRTIMDSGVGMPGCGPTDLPERLP